MRQKFNLNPKNINQPIQLLGASLIGAVFLVGEFLYASTKCPYLIMGWFYGITAILIFPLILYFIFVLQTKYRIELQGDKYFNEAMKRKYQIELMDSEKINLGEIEEWIKKK